ncbi:hypothetical protein MSG28_002146 [Choristoneura fumiferana]|uniref:Uncharacterized protein n=1 Tax=Choristoneura fumiferana TaxID=7141 RepID=A0ACC0JUQ8_CHOFU|nr:hypothetical protein MSG28_002146 [Choristoneura fumiferana]
MAEQNNSVVVPQRTLLGEVNEHITCPLCRGYYIDATTIVECLHSFCRSCIIKHLQVKSYCPVCEMMINSAKPNIKLDKALQDIVYKLVPGLFQKEMERRQQFYSSRPGPAASATPEQRGEDTERIIFSPEDVISFSLEYSDATDTDSISTIRNRLFDIKSRKSSPTPTEDTNVSSPAPNLNDHGSEMSSGTDSPMPDENSGKKTNNTNTDKTSQQSKGNSNQDKPSSSNSSTSKKNDDEVEKSQFLNSFELTAKNNSQPVKSSPVKGSTPEKSISSINDTAKDQVNLPKVEESLKRKQQTPPKTPEMKKLKIELEKAKIPCNIGKEPSISSASSPATTESLNKSENVFDSLMKKKGVEDKPKSLKITSPPANTSTREPKPLGVGGKTGSEGTGMKRAVPGSTNMSSPKRKPTNELPAPSQPASQTKQVSPLKLQIPKLETQTKSSMSMPKPSEVPKPPPKRMPDLKPTTPSSQTSQSRGPPVNKLRMDLLANNCDPTMDRNNKSTPQGKTETSTAQPKPSGKSSESSAKGPVPNLKPIADTKLGKQSATTGTSPLRIPNPISQAKHDKISPGGLHTGAARQDIAKPFPLNQAGGGNSLMSSPSYQPISHNSPNMAQPSPRSQTRSPSSSPKLVIAEEKQASSTSSDSIMSVIQSSIPFKSRKRTCRTNKNQESNENINILNKIELPEVNQKHHIDDIDVKIKDDYESCSAPKIARKASKLDTDIKEGFKQVYVNCTMMKSATSIYSRICKELQLATKSSTEKACLAAIEKYLNKKHKMILLVLDEIDQLDSKRQSVLYSIFEWPALPNSRLLLIGIANALDLTERSLPRLQARCSLRPRTLHFTPYTKQQIINIFTKILGDDKNNVFSPVALQMLAVTVELKQVLEVLNDVYGGSKNIEADVDESFPMQQKLILCSLMLMLTKGKNKDIVMGKLHDVYKKVATARNIAPLDMSEMASACSLLESRGALRCTGASGRGRRIRLQWDETELNAALRDKPLLASILSDVSCLAPTC